MIHSVFLILISIIFVVLSAWNFSIFNRLKDASKQYKDPNVFNYSCHFSKKYVQTSQVFSNVLLIVSMLVMLFTSIMVYLHHM
jgi:uncharacterized membrane protein YidH (DUF202 family)